MEGLTRRDEEGTGTEEEGDSKEESIQRDSVRQQ